MGRKILSDNYIAGFFDGEGSISIAKAIYEYHPSGYGGDKLYPRYSLEIGLANNNREVLVKVKNKYGGKIYCRKISNKRCYVWYLYANKAINFLKKIEPYLEVKQQRANLAIYFQTSLKGRGQLIAKEVAYQKMKRLNKRGE